LAEVGIDATFSAVSKVDSTKKIAHRNETFFIQKEIFQ
jgi:hypothetical protein